MRTGNLVLVLAAGTTLAIAGAASAQTVINVSGATLLQNLANAPAIGNDYIDADNDTQSISGVNNVTRTFPFAPALDSLNPSSVTTPAGQTANFWYVNYCAVGSVNGLQELINFGTTPTSSAADVPVATRAPALFNRTTYINNGVTQGIAIPGNIGAAPGLHASASNFTIVTTGGVYRNDIAPVDVYSVWGLQGAPGTTLSTNVPNTAGYGRNARLVTDASGATILKSGVPQGSNLLASLTVTAGPETLPAKLFTDYASADARTIYDTPICFSPIVPITNLGVGKTQIEMSELRHLFATGRTRSGENLMAVTRDAGSGTRNGFNNSTGIDPSFGVGENIGSTNASAIDAQSNFANEHTLGNEFVPGNKGGSGAMEATVKNHRLAVGYVGGERGVNNSWLTGGQLEILAVRHDLQGGTTYVRPSIANLLANDPAAGGWTIGGPSVLATMGDPRQAPANKGGIGWLASETRPAENTLNYKVPNTEAAALVNNLTRSLEAFVANPLGNGTDFTAGQFLANTYIPVTAPDKRHNKANPLQMDNNGAIDNNLRSYLTSNSVYKNTAYASFGTKTVLGITPTRKSGAGISYGDGVVNGANFITRGGSVVGYAQVSGSLSYMSDRNRVCGDFNGDGARDINDIPDMIDAYIERTGGPAWLAPSGTNGITGTGTGIVLEILGDFNGDGKFDKEDLRYFADGLAMSSGKLNRLQGFVALDTEWANYGGAPLFATTKKGGKPYKNGDARGDISGNTTTRGYKPSGADGAIDEKDINYVIDQYKNAAGKQVDWLNLDQAIFADLSADMNGDRKIDYTDVKVLIENILDMKVGDVNFDGQVNAADLAIVQSNANLGNVTGYQNGDVNGDGIVDAADVAVVQGIISGNSGCNKADITDGSGNGSPDGALTGSDVVSFFSNFFSPCTAPGAIPCNKADITDGSGNGNADGSLTGSDVVTFFSNFFSPCTPR